MDAVSELVTGEAVVLGLQTAKVPSRGLALVLDLCVQGIGLIAVTTVLFMAVPDMDEAAAAAVFLGSFVFFLVGVPVMVETLSHGRSLGKLALGLRVVRSDGGPLRFRHALVRGLTAVLEITMTGGAVALISSLVSPRGRRLGDVFAGTLVVRERLPAAARIQAGPPPVAPALLHAIGEHLVALDLSAVPDGLWLAVRQFLTRLGQLDRTVAEGMAARLADDLAARTGRPAPYGVPAAAYLGAVLTERQRREWERSAEAARRQQDREHFARTSPAPVAAPPVAAPVPVPGDGPKAPPSNGFAPPA